MKNRFSGFPVQPYILLQFCPYMKMRFYTSDLILLGLRLDRWFSWGMKMRIQRIWDSDSGISHLLLVLGIGYWDGSRW